MTRLKITGLVLTIALLYGCNLDEEGASPRMTLRYDFESCEQSWSGGFADLPFLADEADSALYELRFARETLPAPLDNKRHALLLEGHNRSDDLFMFLKRKVTGLDPNREYELVFTITLASDAASGGVGIGGAPGESVYLKAGGSTMEPMSVLQEGFWEMNIDKGNQAQGGAQMVVLGNVANGTSEYKYALIQRSNIGQPVRVRANAQGELWLIAGTDSGFEGFTGLYYDEIKVELR